MKINWGTAIVLVMIGFISFIMYFVITMSSNSKYDHDLVTEEYYKKELVFPDEYEAEKNSKALKENITSRKHPEGWQLLFPDSLEISEISGTVYWYRPSNKKLDFEIPLQLNSSSVIVPKEKLVPGRWNITIAWKYNGVSYLKKETIVY